MHLPPDPDPRTLLPPLLACLPTAFLAPRPPPALLPLLSPVLRQRVNFLNATNSQGNNGWLPLLSWDSHRASRLPEIIERMELEPHPVSGEMELDDVRAIKYRRLDEETLQSRLEVEQFELMPVYVWCEKDEHGGTGPGWKLAELRSLEDTEDGTEWFDDQSDANDAASTSSTLPAPQQQPVPAAAAAADDDDDDDDDGDYWAQYDATPGPSQKPSPGPQSRPAFQPPSSTSVSSARPGLSAQEAEYFARYSNEVQPALDSHDPDEAQTDQLNNNSSTLQGSTQRPRPAATNGVVDKAHDTPLTTSTNSLNQNKSQPQPYTNGEAIPAPQPLTPGSNSSGHNSVANLESQANAMEQQTTTTEAEDRAERAVRQHISTDVKSLFRLARGVGMSRNEFEAVLMREVGVLGMLEEE